MNIHKANVELPEQPSTTIMLDAHEPGHAREEKLFTYAEYARDTYCRMRNHSKADAIDELIINIRRCRQLASQAPGQAVMDASGFVHSLAYMLMEFAAEEHVWLWHKSANRWLVGI